MSSEQSSVHPDTVEQTKQQIRGLVSEIAQLSKSEITPEEYYAAFLQRTVSALAAVGGAIWLLGESKRPELTYQINIAGNLMDSGTEDSKRHARLLDNICRSASPQLIPPMSGESSDEAGGNPTDFLLVLAPLQVDGKVEGLVEVFQRPDSQPATQRGYLRFLQQMCELASEWLKSRKLRHFSDRHNLWAQADEFARLVHESLDLKETSYTVVNEGRRIIGCDRVSLALMRAGNTCKVDAVSGQDTIENRSNIIAAALNRLATRVVATGEPLWYEGVTDDLPPQVEDAVDHYVDESYAKTVTVLPLRKPDSANDPLPTNAAEEAQREGNLHRKVIGALIIEQIETDLPRELIAPRIDLVYEHSSRAISNSVSYNNLFLMPLWRTIGNSAWLVRGRTLPKTLIVGILISLVVLSLFVIPARFKMKSTGTLQPTVRREIFVKTGGVIDEIKVHDGMDVTAGQVLLILKNPDLTIELENIDGELARLVPELNGLLQQRGQQGLSPLENINISSKIGQADGRIQTLKSQRILVMEKIDNLTLKSPIAGQVMIPWDVEKRLPHLPVSPGQPLMIVADPNSDWELELTVPEKRVGHVIRGQRELDEDELRVTYVLKTNSTQKLEGTLKQIGQSTEVLGEEGTVVRMLVEIDKDDLDNPRPGATATARVYCGWRRLGYTWFHEAIEWLQVNILF